MTDRIQSARMGGTYLLQRAKSAAPTFRYKPVAPNSQPKLQRQPIIELHFYQHRLLNGSQGSTNALHQNGDIYENHDIVSTNIKPLDNNPPLPHTQRDIVGNHLQFNSSSQINGWNDISDEELGALILYRDALKQNLTTPNQAGGGVPKMRLGRGGGHWRHIQQTNSHSGSNLLYINGTVRVDDSFKYPIPRFGYPPINRPQRTFSSASSQDFSYTPSNPATQSLDAVTWSPKNELNRRPPLSQYSNCYERHAKDGFAYWPTDTYYKKPRCRTGTTGTYKTWLGLSDSILKL